jgi:hypothetical protein
MIQEIGKIVVVGLKERKDRWERCEEIFRSIGVTKVTHYETLIDYSNIHRNYMKDFTRMLSTERWSGPYLVFFEDDFELVDGWEVVLRKAWSDLPDDFDMLYLGANLTISPVKVTDNLIKVRGAWLMHATILSRKFIDYILKAYDYNRIWIIDEWYRQIAMDRKFYMTYPMISYQRPGWSDAVGAYTDYQIFDNSFYKNYENSCTASRLSSPA